MEYVSRKMSDPRIFNEQIDELTKEMQEFIRKVEEYNTALEEVGVVRLVLPTTDIHSGQMLALLAENAAISDALFFVDQGSERGTINYKMYL